MSKIVKSCCLLINLLVKRLTNIDNYSPSITAQATVACGNGNTKLPGAPTRSPLTRLLAP